VSGASSPRDRWRGEFGRAYTQRNTLSEAQLDALYRRRYGLSREELNAEFLGGLALESVLEVGCNVGMQLRHLRRTTTARLAGIDLQEGALAVARAALPDADLRVAEATAIPHPDRSFDLVFTSSVLIHVPPEDLPVVMDEMVRVSRRWVFGLEYWHASPVEVPYRGESRLLWKRDFAADWLRRHPTLRLVRERRLPYLDEPGLVDTVYLLEKRERAVP
jgi:pseudaminic acid biosynthesis-associated methylase